MGLAASQARLLTITSRKSRAQFENMRLSHQKLALSRNLTDISNEYQNSLNQTKLYYDFYGVNSTDTPLTYDLLMSPSSINDYTPTLITNNQNQVILSTPYADAAKAAGIPMEGLGCQPSSILRDTFMQALAVKGVITQNTADLICNINYNQGAGLGGDNLVNTITTTGDYSILLDYLKGENNTSGVTLNDCDIKNNVAVISVDKNGNKSYYDEDGSLPKFDSVKDKAADSLDSVTFAKLLTDETHIYLGQEKNVTNMYNSVNNIIQQLAAVLGDTVEGSEDAINYANMKMNEECWGDVAPFNTTGENESDTVDDTNLDSYLRHKQGTGYEFDWYDPIWIGGWVDMIFGAFSDVSDSDVAKDSFQASTSLLLIADSYGRSGAFHDDPHDQATLDLSAFTQAWFTYFMQYMCGLGSAKSNELSVKWGRPKDQSNFANEENIGDYKFTLTTEYVSDNEALIANFYDTLFNQICMNGWAKNSQIDKDSNYLKEMLQSGMMYVTSMSDDYYFYQNNYSTNSFIKEVSDDAAIAEAESKYTTEKARINAKEQELDLKMKNLDTEISSLETEYEAVKKVIENNASKSFTRYDG